MPFLGADGRSKIYVCLSDTGVSVKTSNLSGSVAIERFDGNTSMGNMKDETGADYSFSADFEGVFQLRRGDRFQLVQTGGTPASTRYAVGGVKA